MRISYQLSLLRQTRKNMCDLVGTLTLPQLNHIPEGFPNSIGWNFGHALVSQQLLIHARSGKAMIFKDEIVSAFRKGSRPDLPVNNELFSAFLKQATESVNVLERELAQNAFGGFKRYETSFGMVLHNVEEALAFNTAHETMHLGYMMALKHALT